MTLKVRVAIVGLGSMGRNHLRVVSAMPEIEIVALCDSEADRLPIGPWKKLSNYRDITSVRPDYCVVASPTPTHSEMALHLIGQGLSLLVEKPLASSANEARAILKESQSGAGKVAVGMIERFNQTVIEAKRLVESKEFGKLLKVSTRRIGPPPGRDMGVGVLLDLGIHDLDLMQWITGEKLITTQSDFITGVVSPYDDLALVSGRLPSGALWHSEVSWLSPTKKRGLDLLFVSGAVSLDLLTGEVEIIRQSGDENHWDAIRELRGSMGATSTIYGIKTLEPLLSMHRTLVAAISTDDWRTLPRLEDSVEVLDLIETLYLR